MEVQSTKAKDAVFFSVLFVNHFRLRTKRLLLQKWEMHPYSCFFSTICGKKTNNSGVSENVKHFPWYCQPPLSVIPSSLTDYKTADYGCNHHKEQSKTKWSNKNAFQCSGTHSTCWLQRHVFLTLIEAVMQNQVEINRNRQFNEMTDKNIIAGVSICVNQRGTWTHSVLTFVWSLDI